MAVARKLMRQEILETIRDWVKSKITKYKTVTLTASGWNSSTKTQTIAVTGFDASKHLGYPVVDKASTIAYEEAGVRVDDATGAMVTFKCETIPASDLTIHFAIIQTAV